MREGRQSLFSFGARQLLELLRDGRFLDIHLAAQHGFKFLNGLAKRLQVDGFAGRKARRAERGFVVNGTRA